MQIIFSFKKEYSLGSSQRKANENSKHHSSSSQFCSSPWGKNKKKEKTKKERKKIESVFPGKKNWP